MIEDENVRMLANHWREEWDRKARREAVRKLNDMSRNEQGAFDSPSYRAQQKRLEAEIEEVIHGVTAALTKPEAERDD